MAGQLKQPLSPARGGSDSATWVRIWQPRGVNFPPVIVQMRDGTPPTGGWWNGRQPKIQLASKRKSRRFVRAHKPAWEEEPTGYGRSSVGPNVGVNCDFQATGETVKDVMQRCANHAKSAHGMDEITPELAEKVQSAIREV